MDPVCRSHRTGILIHEISTRPCPPPSSQSKDHAELDRYACLAPWKPLLPIRRARLQAVARAATDIARAVDAATPRIEAGGRLIYVGAGTSGRLGLLDSVELYPTFSWPPERAPLPFWPEEKGRCFVRWKVRRDRTEQGGVDIRAEHGRERCGDRAGCFGHDTLCAWRHWWRRALGALTIGISNNASAPVASEAEIGIVIDTGPEVISGSTRLKAGTAQKIALNTFSSALMVRLNKVYGNLMVDLKATNAKLVRRAERLTSLATGCDAAVARAAPDQCDNHVKTAIVMIPLRRIGRRRGRAFGRRARQRAISANEYHHAPADRGRGGRNPGVDSTLHFAQACRM